LTIDPSNPVVALCAAGMAVEGDAAAALLLFERAWDIRRDDYEASIAAHFLARHQPTVETRLQWNVLAAQHAEAVTDDRSSDLMASLYLNLGDAYLAVGDRANARLAAVHAGASVASLPVGGYRTFVERGIEDLQRRIAEAVIVAQNI
jgi:hypothetical protein